MAFHNEEHFIAVGVTGTGAARQIAVRERRAKDQAAVGQAIASTPLSGTGPVELRIEIVDGSGNLSWRPVGSKVWRSVAKGVNIEHMASIHAGLFTGTVVGPYAQRGE